MPQFGIILSVRGVLDRMRGVTRRYDSAWAASTYPVARNPVHSGAR
jgi:hypothetical protein